MSLLPVVSCLGGTCAPVWRAVRFACFTLALAATLTAAEKWCTVRTENFEVFSAAPEKKTREMVVKLEQFRASFLSSFKFRPVHEPHVTVILFDSDRAFTPYKPTYHGRPKEVTGFFIGGDDEAVIALNLGGDGDGEGGATETIFHEYIHMLVHTREMNLPTWLDEGLAELFSTFQVIGSTVEYGSPKQSYVDLLNQVALMPMSRLMSVNESSPDYNEEERAGIFYAQAWATAHLLVCGADRTNGAKLGRFIAITAAKTGVTPEAAFREAFGAGSEKMENDLRSYLRGGRYFKRKEPVPLKDFGANLVIRPATDFERDLALLNLRWRVHRSGETMLAALHLAGRDPTSPRPQEILGLVAAADGDVESALKRWAKAAELGSRNSFVLVQASRARLLEIGWMTDPEERLTADDARQLRGWLDHAIQVSPMYDDPVELLAHVEAHAPEFRVGMINALQGRVAGLKNPAQTLLSLAVIRWRAKDRATADNLVKVVLDSSRAKIEVKLLAKLLADRFAEDNAPKPKPPTPALAFVPTEAGAGTESATASAATTAGGGDGGGDGTGTVLIIPVPRPRTTKAGAGQTKSLPPRVQALRLPEEAAIFTPTEEMKHGMADGELADRVVAAVANATAGGETPPVVIYRAVAVYPEAQRRFGIAGSARVELTVNETGHPEKVRERNSTVPDFGKAAVECVKQWRFLPAIKDGKPVSTLIEVPLTFDVGAPGK